MNWVISAILFVSMSAFGDAGAKSPPIKNFHSVTDRIFRGSHPQTEEDFAYLQRLGVKIIINLQGGDYSDNGWFGKNIIPKWENGETPEEIAREFELAAKHDIQVVNLPLNALKVIDATHEERIETALKIMNESTESLYIHCAHGADRTGLVVALFRMKYQHWSADAAYAEMRRLGHSVVHMITTWPMDEFFFRYARAIHLIGFINLRVIRSLSPTDSYFSLSLAS
jgi:protein tyrosine/serine phosphatase